MAGLLSKERIVAGPGFNRWLVPPAALAIHLCIGQAYALSVFKIPLSQAIGITHAAPDDWTFTQLASIFQIAIVFLGLSAAVGGKWLERVGPRRSGLVSACCWGAGFLISSYAVQIHNLWLLRLGYGVIGGCGLGLGYITPVSTLIRWFPDRRGMATGMAIMGFGGGAMIASPLSQILMDRFKSATSVGVVETFVTLGIIYFVAMVAGAFLFRIPAPGWKPAGWTPPTQASALITRNHVHVSQAVRTPQFYLLWVVLFLNVTAGIGILEHASPMIQEMFKGTVTASAAAGFTGLLSLFNMGGRFFWASISDKIGRKATYAVFFLLGPILYASVPFAGKIGSVALFVACTAIILTMYGGGFATIPAYISDIFGTQYVGAIHGRLLTAWSAAGIMGPELVNQLRQYQIGRGVDPAQSYNFTMYLMAGLLLIALFANLAISRVNERFHMSAQELDREHAALLHATMARS
ncbi:MAG: OFA family MFS transporter [Gemmatimonadota bacterium]